MRHQGEQRRRTHPEVRRPIFFRKGVSLATSQECLCYNKLEASFSSACTQFVYDKTKMEYFDQDKNNPKPMFVEKCPRLQTFFEGIKSILHTIFRSMSKFISYFRRFKRGIQATRIPPKHHRIAKHGAELRGKWLALLQQEQERQRIDFQKKWRGRKSRPKPQVVFHTPSC